jgi:hypothetical protein
MDEQQQPPVMLMVRFRKGVVGETRRVCHLIPLPVGHELPSVLTTYCSVEIGPGEAELLRSAEGMPCEPCLRLAPVPSPDEPLPIEP